jgi:hypothetical protein
MPLSPADFYAYSRATGTPVPEDAEERARIASDVYDFRQNQLKTPEQGPNYGAIAGLSALGLGLVAGGVGLARAFRGRAPQTAAKDVIKQRQAAEPVVQAVAKAGVPVVRTTTETVQPSRVVEQAPVATKITVKPAKDRAQELVDEYRSYIDLEQKGFAPQTKSERTEQLAEQNRQRGSVNRAIRSRGEELLAEIQNEAKPFNRTYIESTGAVKPVLDVGTRLDNAGISLSGDLDELEVSAGIDTIPSRLNHPYSNHPKASIRQTAQQEEQTARALLQKAGVTPEEATSYWKGVLDRFVETDEDLTSIQQSEAPQLAAQQHAAVESGEDQATGRFQHMLQLNEDLDTSQIDVMEEMAAHQYHVGMEQDEPGRSLITQLPDGIPHIQQEHLTTSLVPLDQETSAQRYFANTRAEIASELNSQGLPATPSRIESELGNRFGHEASQYGPKQSARKQSLELYAQTGNRVLLEKVRPYGLSSVTFRPSEQEIRIAGLPAGRLINMPVLGDTDISRLRKPVINEATALQAEEFVQSKKEEALNWLGNLRVKLEPQRNKILKERRLLIEDQAAKLAPQLEQAKLHGQDELVDELNFQLQNLRHLWQNPELAQHRKNEMSLLNAQLAGAKKTIDKSISDISKKYPTTLRNWEEVPRIFYQRNPATDEIIPQTVEIRSGERSTIESEKSRGSSQQIASRIVYQTTPDEWTFDPDTGKRIELNPSVEWEEVNKPSSSIGIYGVEPTAMAPGYQSSAAEKKPTYVEGFSNLTEYLTGKEASERGVNPKQPQPKNWRVLNEMDSDTLNKVVKNNQSPNASNEALNVAMQAERVLLSRQDPGALQRQQQTLRSIDAAEAVRYLQSQGADAQQQLKTLFPGSQSEIYRSSPLALPLPRTEAKRQPLPPVQLNLASDVVPSTAAAARVRMSPADQAANQLENYLSRLQRGRTTPLTSAVRIQPNLF